MKTFILIGVSADSSKNARTSDIGRNHFDTTKKITVRNIAGLELPFPGQLIHMAGHANVERCEYYIDEETDSALKNKRQRNVEVRPGHRTPSESSGIRDWGASCVQKGWEGL